MPLNFNKLDSDLINELAAIAGNANLSTTDADRTLHARDQSQHDAHMPDVVIWAESGAQVSGVLKFANDHCIPVTPWGAGTSLEGNPIPLYGGILLSFERMNQIIAVHDADFQVTVQPGIGHYDLNKELARYGLFFPPDPGANASIGGMLANNAAGIRTVKYGAAKDNVLRMQVALADGRLIEVGSRSVKQSSGYDLLHLFVGSEGTLGIITEATLKLVPVLEHISAVLAFFPTVQAAVEAVVAIRGSGLDPAALELIDAAHARMLSQAEGVNLEPTPTLFMEFQGMVPEALETGLSIAHDICKELGATHVRTATDHTERAQLWHARHAAHEIVVRAHPGKRFYIADVAVPISSIPEMSQYIEQRLQHYNLIGYLVGHAGDGNIHVNVPFEGQAEYETARAFNTDLIQKALSLGGTATGEHGIGMTKRPYMPDEHGAALDVMRSVKHILDPNGILNPGKVFP